MGFTIVDFLIMALATWRISAIITEERGPFGMFEAIRKATLKHRAKNHLSPVTLATCIMCLSVWVAPFVFLAYYYIPELVWIFAISGAALMLRTYSGVQHG